jgi:hypothetical protein
MIDFQLNEEFLDNVEKFTERKFTQRTTLSQLIKTINKNNQIEKFNELIFTAKYTNGLYRSIKLSQSNPQISNLEQIKKDFSENLEKVMSLIKDIFNKEISESTTEIKQMYTEFGEVQLGNLILLIDDLDQIKKYLNYLKRNT